MSFLSCFPRELVFPAYLIALTGVLAIARPDLTRTQKSEIKTVPADQPPPGPNEVTITLESDRRVITANGLPDHPTGRFPNADNPNPIRSQRYRFTVPARPQPATQPTPMERRPFGIALNGVLFDPDTAEYWQGNRSSGWHYDALGGAFSLGLDDNLAHVQPNGAYHYHGVPAALLRRLSQGEPKMTLVGWAADGFPIYAVWAYRVAGDASSGVKPMRSSYQLRPGSRPVEKGQPGGTHSGVFNEDFTYVAGSGDLDECGGRTGVTPEFPQGTYYYVLTEDFPFVPRAFRGAPDASFAVRQGPPPRGKGGPPRKGGS
jgi:hypothetical protein